MCMVAMVHFLVFLSINQSVNIIEHPNIDMNKFSSHGDKS